MKYLMILIVIILILLIGYSIFIYKKLKSLKNAIDDEYYDIDINLKKRNELIPKLIEKVKTLVKKKDLINAVMENKNKIIELDNRSELLKCDILISNDLDAMTKLVEKNKSIIKDMDYQALKQEINTIEKDLIDSRNSYNKAVNIYNVELSKKTVKVFGFIFGFKEEPLSKDEI